MLERPKSGSRARRPVNIARGSRFTVGKHGRRLARRQKMGAMKGVRKPAPFRKGVKRASMSSSTSGMRSPTVKKPVEAKPKGTGELQKLVDLSTTMTDVFSKTLETMRHVSAEAQNTARAMRSLAQLQSGKAPWRGSVASPGTPGSHYDKQGFMGGNTGGPMSREYLESKVEQLVEVKVVFIRIHDIDTINQVFEAEIFIQARWRERRFLGYTESALEDIEFYQCRDPQLKLLNVAGKLDMERTSMVLRYEPDSISPVLVYMWHVKGVFRERMELQHFPFDVQELSVVLSSNLPVGKVELVGDFFRASSVSVGALEVTLLFVLH
ncbi:hypothetical protein RRG08_032479 [Elysia crispata]|uniref:Uncharacterized protein n=1 Tax=Elysia crispata TaxID=231223 RepID=A0AAE1BAQ9_9GAST|nr:hypothetical protein RRG08_032479 [Elysia crispata]